MKNKNEIFALVIISAFIIGVFLIGPKYTGFAVLEGGEKIYITEAISDEENVTDEIKSLDANFTTIKAGKLLEINFSDYLENNDTINIYLEYKKNNSNINIYDNNTIVGFINFNATLDELMWRNTTLNLSSSQNKININATQKVKFDYIEATSPTTTTTTTTTTIPSSSSSSESDGSSEKPVSKVFIYTREEEPSEEISEEETQSEEIVEEAKIEATPIQAEVVREQEEEFVEKIESSIFETVGNTIVGDIETLTLRET